MSRRRHCSSCHCRCRYCRRGVYRRGYGSFPVTSSSTPRWERSGGTLFFLFCKVGGSSDVKAAGFEQLGGMAEEDARGMREVECDRPGRGAAEDVGGVGATRGSEIQPDPESRDQVAVNRVTVPTPPRAEIPAEFSPHRCQRLSGSSFTDSFPQPYRLPVRHCQCWNYKSGPHFGMADGTPGNKRGRTGASTPAGRNT